MDSGWLESERQRAAALLAPERTGVLMQPVALNPLPEALGALAGIGWTTDAPEVRVNVYLFADWDQASRVGPVLTEMVDGGVYYVQTATNGGLLFFAAARLDHPHPDESRARVDRLMSAFSGLE
jgi:hypothetical protein